MPEPRRNNVRPDLVGTTVHLPPGQWWTDDGWLHMRVDRVGPFTTDRDLPTGWIWVMGDLLNGDQVVDTCNVPVRVGALPAGPYVHDLRVDAPPAPAAVAGGPARA